MKIALCQIAMKWTIEENVLSIKSWIKKAAEQGADLALFTECAVTGYHRRIAEFSTLEHLQKAHKEIQNYVDETKMACLIGSPYISADKVDEIYNSFLFFKPEANDFEIASKIGLTSVEKQFFTPAKSRNIFTFKDLNIGTIFCREINDKEEILADFRDKNLDLIVWPSYILWTADPGVEDFCDSKDAAFYSKKLNVPVININAAIAINNLELQGLGGSPYAVDGELKSKCLADQEELKLITI